MMKLLYSYLKEMKLASKSFYFYVELVMAILIIIILLFIVPKRYHQVSDEYLSFDMPPLVEENYRQSIMEKDIDGKLEEKTLKLSGEKITADLYETENRRIYVIPKREQMVGLTKEDRPSIGAHIEFNDRIGEKGDFVYAYYLQGYENERLLNLYRIFHNEDLRIIEDKNDALVVRSLDTIGVSLNTREFALPSLLTFNGSLMGMFIMAAYIFLDKGEGVIKAYAVTASKVWQYLMSKIMVMITVTIITTLAIAFAVVGTRINYLLLVVLLITSSFAASSLALLITSFYNDMTKAFGALYVVMMILMLPAISYFVPSWQPLWVRLIPTYYLIQGFKDIVINQGSMGFVLISSSVFFIVGAVLFILSNYRFKKTLTS